MALTNKKIALLCMSILTFTGYVEIINAAQNSKHNNIYPYKYNSGIIPFYEKTSNKPSPIKTGSSVLHFDSLLEMINKNKILQNSFDMELISILRYIPDNIKDKFIDRIQIIINRYNTGVNLQYYKGKKSSNNFGQSHNINFIVPNSITHYLLQNFVDGKKIPFHTMDYIVKQVTTRNQQSGDNNVLAQFIAKLLLLNMETDDKINMFSQYRDCLLKGNMETDKHNIMLSLAHILSYDMLMINNANRATNNLISSDDVIVELIKMQLALKKKNEFVNVYSKLDASCSSNKNVMDNIVDYIYCNHSSFYNNQSTENTDLLTSIYMLSTRFDDNNKRTYDANSVKGDIESFLFGQKSIRNFTRLENMIFAKHARAKNKKEVDLTYRNPSSSNTKIVTFDIDAIMSELQQIDNNKKYNFSTTNKEKLNNILSNSYGVAKYKIMKLLISDNDMLSNGDKELKQNVLKYLQANDAQGVLSVNDGLKIVSSYDGFSANSCENFVSTLMSAIRDNTSGGKLFFDMTREQVLNMKRDLTPLGNSFAKIIVNYMIKKYGMFDTNNGNKKLEFNVLDVQEILGIYLAGYKQVLYCMPHNTLYELFMSCYAYGNKSERVINSVLHDLVNSGQYLRMYYVKLTMELYYLAKQNTDVNADSMLDIINDLLGIFDNVVQNKLSSSNANALISFYTNLNFQKLNDTLYKTIVDKINTYYADNNYTTNAELIQLKKNFLNALQKDLTHTGIKQSGYIEKRILQVLLADIVEQSDFLQNHAVNKNGEMRLVDIMQYLSENNSHSNKTYLERIFEANQFIQQLDFVSLENINELNNEVTNIFTGMNNANLMKKQLTKFLEDIINKCLKQNVIINISRQNISLIAENIIKICAINNGFLRTLGSMSAIEFIMLLHSFNQYINNSNNKLQMFPAHVIYKAMMEVFILRKYVTNKNNGGNNQQLIQDIVSDYVLNSHFNLSNKYTCNVADSVFSTEISDKLSTTLRPGYFDNNSTQLSGNGGEGDHDGDAGGEGDHDGDAGGEGDHDGDTGGEGDHDGDISGIPSHEYDDEDHDEVISNFLGIVPDDVGSVEDTFA